MEIDLLQVLCESLIRNLSIYYNNIRHIRLCIIGEKTNMKNVAAGCKTLEGICYMATLIQIFRYVLVSK